MRLGKPVLLLAWLGLLALMALFGYGMLRLGRWTITGLAALNPEIVAAVIATLGTVLAGVAAVILAQRWTKDREIAEAHRPQKVKLYSTFIKGVIDILLRFKGNPAQQKKLAADKQIQKFFTDFTTDLILWGGPSVIRSYMAFRAAGASESQDVILRMDDVFRAIRRDLGHNNWGLSRGDLIKIFLTDPDRLDELLEKRGRDIEQVSA